MKNSEVEILINDVLASHKLTLRLYYSGCVLNIYVYKAALVGVIEHPKYRRICDMNSFGFTAQDYIAWRHSQQKIPSSILGRNGKHVSNSELRSKMYETSQETGWPVFVASPVPKEDLFDLE